MKWAPLAFAGLLGVTTACVVDSQHPTCPTKTISNIVANFDDRKNAEKLTTYQHLNFNKATVSHQGSGDHYRGVNPYSKPYYGIAYPVPNEPAGIYLSLTDTQTTSFDFYSARIGCLAPNNIRSGFEAVACNISIDCETYLSMEGHLGPQTFNYIPNKPFGADMMLAAPSGYNYCQHVPISIDGRWPSDAIVVVDELKYTIRQGECIPGSPGDPGPGCP